MPPPPRPTDLAVLRARAGSLTTRDLIRELEARGWTEVKRRGKGSHQIWRKPGARRIVIPVKPARPTILGVLSDLEQDERSRE